MFNRFNKPRPGVEKDAPKKKGVALFLSILWREFGAFIKLNFFMILSFALPFAVFYIAITALFSGAPLFAALLCIPMIALCLLSGPVYAASSRLLVQMLRDEPGYFWHDFKKSFANSFKQTSGIGVFSNLALFSLIFISVIAPQSFEVDFFTAVFFILCGLLILVVTPIYSVQAAFMTLGVNSMVRNSLLFTFKFIVRNFFGGVVMAAALIAQIFFIPYTVPVMLLIGLSVPFFASLMVMWPKINVTFEIDKRLNELEEQTISKSIKQPSE